MQPCEAVCLLSASRLVFPKQAAGLWQRFVCVHACLSVCTHLLDNTVQGVHAKLSLTFVCVCVILFISVSVSQPVHLSI